MKIKAEIKKVFNDNDNLKAVANVIFDDCFIVKNLRVTEGNKGLFVSMPSRRNVNGEYTEICFPLSPELRHDLSETVLQAYKQALDSLAVAANKAKKD